MKIPVDQIVASSEAQLRETMDEFIVDEYAEAMQSGASFPAIVVFEEEGSYYIADGFHRYEAARRCGVERIDCDVLRSFERDGVTETGHRAAILFSAGANATHGQKRRNADKRRAVQALLADDVWGQRSDGWIAEAAGVSQPFVSKLHRELTQNGFESDRREGRDGRVIRTEPIGRQRLDERTRELIRETPIADDPRALDSLARIRDVDKQREVARSLRDGEHRTVQLAKRYVDNRQKVKASLEVERRYFVVYADPPWRFANDGMRGAAEDVYPTMSFDELAELPVGDIAQDESVLFLWATNTHLLDAGRLLDRWGFEYRTNFVWVKNRISRFRFYHRARHELLLFATRGTGLLPAGDDLVDSVIEADVRGHSQKPDCVYEFIERYYPDAPKIELFARATRDGWTAWGNEVTSAASA